MLALVLTTQRNTDTHKNCSFTITEYLLRSHKEYYFLKLCLQVRSGGEAVVERFFDWFYWFIQIGGLIAYTAVVYVQQEIAFFYGYLIAALSMLLAIMIFMSGRNHYLTHPPQGSAVSQTVKIICQGLKKIRCRRGDDKPSITWLDRTKISEGGDFPDSEVEDVKTLLPIFPVFLTFIFYWTIFGQVC